MNAVFPYLKASGGRIINLGCGGGRDSGVGLGPYGISKEAMHALSRKAAKKWGKYRINFNGIFAFRDDARPGEDIKRETGAPKTPHPASRLFWRCGA
jgi:NAD(P)-dependent dehydrogenase (short-subunit alcohol dehydrogenase family)